MEFQQTAAAAAFRDVQRIREGRDGGERTLLETQTRRRVIHCIEKALELDCSYAPALFAKGEMLFLANVFKNDARSEPSLRDPDFERALSCFDEAIRAQPTLATAHVYKGDVLARRGRHDEALACYERALGLDASDSRAWFGKASVMKEMGDEREAERCTEVAESVKPQTQLAWRPSIYRWVSLKAE